MVKQNAEVRFLRWMLGTRTMKKSGVSEGESASGADLEEIAELGIGGENPCQDAQAHQGSRPGRRRGVEVDGHPVWSHDGIICTGETYKSVVKLTFAKGAR
jgi:hypothetical protein